ncbi:class I SAM-dependent methyltransferase [Enterococcus hirae]|uniref:class I SAM-dependent methyltransferase n=1 Tax=Enterococcus hirae TaxID=1354 RepID=UPI001A963370|nr:class I SAM-dependent methyltransferase [Enterococcus hirae]MBO1088992.1 class I SAM-dependent methyltransferase [Enterococcus hirae]MEB7516662.1 class I SAM-dependent methyltransferase [Enterococcus hirae]
MMDQLKKVWLKSEEQQKNFTGWDFSYLDGKWSCEEPPWDYRELVLNYLTPTMSLLDMGTGGGELLQTFNHPYEQTAVTEGYPPNYQLLLQTLDPQGVTVKFVGEEDVLDFPDDSFDLVINSHESFVVAEVKRVLKPDGLFISQQVGDFNGVNLASRLMPEVRKECFDFHLSLVKAELEQHHFDLLFCDEAYLNQQFFDMDSLIFYVRTIEWEYPGFTVEKNFKELLGLYEELKRHGTIYNLQHRFAFVARNTK